jgi:hypothetical protein
LAATTIVAVESGAFASGFGPEPEISIGRETVLHFEDANPSQIGIQRHGEHCLALTIVMAKRLVGLAHDFALRMDNAGERPCANHQFCVVVKRKWMQHAA